MSYKTRNFKNGWESHWWKKMKATHTQNGMIGSAHGPKESVLCKWFHSLEEIQRVDVILLKIPTNCLTHDNQEVPYVSGEAKAPHECPYTLQQKCKFQKHKLPDLQLDCKPTIMKTAWYWHTRHPHRCKEENREPQKKAKLDRSKEVRKSNGDKIACAMHGSGKPGPLMLKNHNGFLSQATKNKNLTPNRLLQCEIWSQTRPNRNP